MSWRSSIKMSSWVPYLRSRFSAETAGMREFVVFSWLRKTASTKYTMGGYSYQSLTVPTLTNYPIQHHDGEDRRQVHIRVPEKGERRFLGLIAPQAKREIDQSAAQ